MGLKTDVGITSVFCRYCVGAGGTWCWGWWVSPTLRREEAGVRGRVQERALGVYGYAKRGPRGPLPCLAMVHPLEVTALAKHYPEKGQRRRKWCSRKKAAGLVGGKDLARLIANFDPRIS